MEHAQLPNCRARVELLENALRDVSAELRTLAEEEELEGLTPIADRIDYLLERA